MSSRILRYDLLETGFDVQRRMADWHFAQGSNRLGLASSPAMWESEWSALLGVWGRKGEEGMECRISVAFPARGLMRAD